MNNINNIWIENGYKEGDIIVFFDKRKQLTLIYQLCTLTIKDERYHNFINLCNITSNINKIAYISPRMTQDFKFKVQDYIDDISSPTETEILLLKLQFPEVDINKVISRIK